MIVTIVAYCVSHNAIIPFASSLAFRQSKFTWRNDKKEMRRSQYFLEIFKYQFVVSIEYRTRLFEHTTVASAIVFTTF